MRMAGSGGGSTASGADLDQRSLYLDLLERALTHTLYHPPDTRELPEDVKEAFAEEFIRLGVAQEFLRLNEPKDARDSERREEGKDWPVYAQTMVGLKRLRNVRECVETALADGVPGDLIEAGCWRGGVAIMMRGILRAHGVEDRAVWAADSFAGLPAPNPERFPADAGDVGHKAEELAVSLDEVRDNFRRYELLDDQVKFLEGWFSETLPTVKNRR
jgi:O-methyltransferase